LSAFIRLIASLAAANAVRQACFSAPPSSPTFLVQHRAGHALEIFVENGQKFSPAHGVGERGRAAQVAEPDHRVNLGAVAALDLSGQHLGAGLLAKIGVEQIDRRALERIDLGNPRQRDLNLPQSLEVGLAETAGPARRPGRGVDLPVGEFQRLREIVGDAFLAQICEDREIDRAVGLLQLPPDFLAVLEHLRDRAADIDIGLAYVVGRFQDAHFGVALAP
jgi:hypothetical protein